MNTSVLLAFLGFVAGLVLLIGLGLWIGYQKRIKQKLPLPIKAPTGWTNVSIRPHGDKGKGIR
jgi:ABC-type nitrate/sulfonate/bicarbonate transport system permease component